MDFRRLMGALLIAAAAILGSLPNAAAQDYPKHPVRMIVAYPPGGTLDTLARIIAQKLSEKWGQSVIVENRAGAAGNIGASAAARSAPDGYTLHFGAQSLAVNVTLVPMDGFDPVKDFDPVVLAATAQDVLMVPRDSPFQSVKDLIAYAKDNPNKLNYATLGPGSSADLATLLFSNLTGIKMENVPYSSLSQASTDVISGRVSVFIPTLGGHLPNIKAGNLRALAVSGETRAAQLPDVPTFNELGVPFVGETSWYGIFTPKGTPSDIISKVNKDVNDILQEDDVKQKSDALGFRILGGSPDVLGAKLKDEIARWAKVLQNTPASP